MTTQLNIPEQKCQHGTTRKLFSYYPHHQPRRLVVTYEVGGEGGFSYDFSHSTSAFTYKTFPPPA